MIRLELFLILGFMIIIIGCSAKIDEASAQIDIEEAFPNLLFTRPVDFQHTRDGSDRLFVVEQQGIIYVFNNNSTVNDKKVFLDIRDRVNDSGNEEGLLGLAFHPDFKSNGYFFVYYSASDSRHSVISRFEVTTLNPDSADENSEIIILEVSQPYSNHNGGQIVFGPDGYLYIALGDGGSGGDPQNNGQNLMTLLGSILRIDVDNPLNGLNYGIPVDNPFKGNSMGYKEEIYAYGLRNPWRFSFDPVTKWLWAADVGQNAYEEIDIIEKGMNYGWNIMEGLHRYGGSTKDTTELVLPVWEYGHDVGQSITGGFIYRGTLLPELEGKYIYADFVSGRIWALEYDGINNPKNTLLKDTNLNISTFGFDNNNELYLCAFDGKIYRLKSNTKDVLEDMNKNVGTFQLRQNYPNPFNAFTTISYTIRRKLWAE